MSKVKSFLEFLKVEKKMSINTLQSYERDVLQFSKYLDENKLIDYVRGIQSNSKIDSNAMIMPSDMPGYEDKIVMASGSFTQGSSIELSCDGPLRSPYIAYQQGGISYKYGKIIVTRAIKYLIEK